MKATGIILVIVVALGVGAYFLLQDNNSFRVSFFGAGASEGAHTSTSSQPYASSTESIVTSAQRIGENVLSTLRDAGVWVGAKSAEIFTSARDAIQSAVTDTAKDTAQKALTSVGSTLGISSSSENTSLSISYIIHKNTSTSFVLRDTSYKKDQEIASYRIDWGDGTLDAQDGVVVQSTSTFSHSWQNTGDYMVSFRIVRADKESVYVTDVTVK